MKRLVDLWKNTFLKYVDINNDGKLNVFEIFIIITIVFTYNVFFQVIGNYIYDLIKK